MKCVENTEPPLQYHLWTAISVLAGALQRKVYVKWGSDTIFPNLYIILVGPPGRARKGTALKIGKGILEEINVELVSESITTEGLIRRMARTPQNFTDPTSSQVIIHCSLTCISEELSVFLGQKDIKFLATLCDWYDSADHWTYETKNQGVDKLEGVCFNLLGATTPDWIPSTLPKEAIGGGFSSRVVWIVEEKKQKVVEVPTIAEPIRDALIHDLEVIHLLMGQMDFSPDALAYYTKFYRTQERCIELDKPPINHPQFAGYCDRRATLIKKLSMVCCASRTDARVIEAQDMERAERFMIQAERRMPQAFKGLGEARYVAVTQLFMDYLLPRKQVTRSKVLKFFWRDIDNYTIDIITKSLYNSRVIDIQQHGQRDLMYILIDADWEGGKTDDTRELQQPDSVSSCGEDQESVGTEGAAVCSPERQAK